MMKTLLETRLGLIPDAVLTEMRKLSHEQLLHLGSTLWSIRSVEELSMALKNLGGHNA